jgi:hypothetical protein
MADRSVLIDAIDTYFLYVAQQLAILDSTQVLCGTVNARDWPLTPPNTDGGLYLLFLRAVPVGGTDSQTLWEYFCQWSWILLGTDIQSTQISENRGDVYRRDMAIANNVRQASFPGYCIKKSVAANSEGTLTVTPYTGAAVYGAESVWWTRPRISPRRDPNSGVLYGTAVLELYAFDDVNALVA